MKKFVLVSLLVVGFSGVAVAGDYDISQDGNTRNGTLRQGRVEAAEVLDVREVKIEPTRTAQMTGTGIGAATGAVIGSQLGKKNRFVSGTLGGIIGGVVGNVAADKVTQATAQELILKKDDGKLITITQADSELVEGDKVYIVESAGKLRVRKQ